MDTEDVLQLSAVEQSRLIRRGQLSATTLVRHSLDRIDRLNPQLGAFVEVMRRTALAEAAALDLKRRVLGVLDANYPLWGIPTAIKDLELVRFTGARMGSRAYRWLWSPFDGICARRMRRSGMVIVGKSATSELGAMPITETDIHPPARNPWNPAYSSGGSSGGSGAAVGANLVSVAHGSDGAGSIRIPAALCGVFGYKPSRGLMVNPYDKIDKLRMATCGPLARHFEDAIALADILRADADSPTLTSALTATPGKLKVASTKTSPIGAVPADLTNPVDMVAAWAAELGHDVTEIVPLQGTVEEFLPIYERQFATMPLLKPGALQPVTRWLRERGKRHTATDIRKVVDGLVARTHESWGKADVWITPAIGCAIPKVGEVHGLPPEEQFHRVAPLGAFTAVFNLTGQPAITIPVGVGADGLPRAVQLVGRLHSDRQLIAFAKQLIDAGGLRAQSAPIA